MARLTLPLKDAPAEDNRDLRRMIAELQASQEQLTRAVLALTSEVRAVRSRATPAFPMANCETIECPLLHKFPFQGIIHFIQTTYDRWSDFIEPKSSSVNAGKVVDYGAQNALLPNDRLSFVSEAKQEEWFCVDFKAMRVAVTAYAIRSRHETGSCCPRSWQILGSDDGDTWELLDERYCVDAMTGVSQPAFFDASRVLTCRLIKIKQTGFNGDACNYLAFSSFDVFGKLMLPGTA
jgi:hypothetical protein